MRSARVVPSPESSSHYHSWPHGPELGGNKVSSYQQRPANKVWIGSSTPWKDTQVCVNVVGRDKHHESAMFFCLLLLWWLMSPPTPTAATDHGMIFLLWHGNSSGSDYCESTATTLAQRLCMLSDCVTEPRHGRWCLLGVRVGHFVGLEQRYGRRTSMEKRQGDNKVFLDFPASAMCGWGSSVGKGETTFYHSWLWLQTNQLAEG